MSEINTSGPKGKRRSLSQRNRLSTRVDLTPMVDLGFLLITFFVFTTTMSQPMAMNIIQPHEGEYTPARESGAMTILVGEKDRLAYYYGMLDPASPGQIKATNFNEIRSLIRNKKKQTRIDHLLFVIKADSLACFGSNIDLLDEMTISAIPPGHYCEGEITNEEAAIFTHEL